MSWYSIRHSVGTYMTREEDLAAAQTQLRHKSRKTTMKYDQTPVEDRKDALDRMGRLFVVYILVRPPTQYTMGVYNVFFFDVVKNETPFPETSGKPVSGLCDDPPSVVDRGGFFCVCRVGGVVGTAPHIVGVGEN